MLCMSDLIWHRLKSGISGDTRFLFFFKRAKTKKISMSDPEFCSLLVVKCGHIMVVKTWSE